VKTPVGQVAELVTKGTTPTSVGLTYSDGGIPFLRVKDLQDGATVVDSETLFISSETDKELARSRIRAGDVLLSIAGTIGRVALVPDGAPDMNCNQAVAIVRTNGAVRPRFLRAALESQVVQSQIIKSTVTGTISNLSLAQVRALKISVPAPTEQTQYEAVDETYRAALRRDSAHLTQLDALFAALQHRAFAGAP
jgi:type I restriction enzyme S subunit